jgi:hypothetical protein
VALFQPTDIKTMNEAAALLIGEQILKASAK